MNIDVITYNNLLRLVDNMLNKGIIPTITHDLIADAIRQAYGCRQEDRNTTMNSVDVQKVIFNPPATIVFWGDGTKTVVKTMSEEPFDMYHGFTAALAKKVYGNSTRVRKLVHKFEDSYYKAHAEEIVHKFDDSYRKARAEETNQPAPEAEVHCARRQNWVETHTDSKSTGISTQKREAKC